VLQLLLLVNTVAVAEMSLKYRVNLVAIYHVTQLHYSSHIFVIITLQCVLYVQSSCSPVHYTANELSASRCWMVSVATSQWNSLFIQSLVSYGFLILTCWHTNATANTNRACKLFNIHLYATLCFNYFRLHRHMFSYCSVFELLIC